MDIQVHGVRRKQALERQVRSSYWLKLGGLKFVIFTYDFSKNLGISEIIQFYKELLSIHGLAACIALVLGAYMLSYNTKWGKRLLVASAFMKNHNSRACNHNGNGA